MNAKQKKEESRKKRGDHLGTKTEKKRGRVGGQVPRGKKHEKKDTGKHNDSKKEKGHGYSNRGVGVHLGVIHHQSNEEGGKLLLKKEEKKNRNRYNRWQRRIDLGEHTNNTKVKNRRSSPEQHLTTTMN